MTTKEIQRFRIIGIGIRTSHALENSIKQRIPELWQRFIDERLHEKIPNQLESNKLCGLLGISR
ncbi:MAG: hypothetical protein HRU19_14080 [Pseudobacteriovorax sp.]|nr:hypothetical protein [Pseudobacteriovorax sp.]